MSRIVPINDNYKNTATIIECTFTEDDIAEPITRGTIWLSIYDRNGNEFLKKSFVSFKDGPNGLADLTVTASENSTVGVYRYYVVYVDSSGIPHLVLNGPYTILECEGGPFTLLSTTTTTTSSTTTSSSTTTTTTTAP